MDRFADYVRVSTDKQEDSPERQLSLIEPYVQAKGYRRVCQPYVDLNQKGWKDDRPAFQRLLADAKSGKFDVVVVDQGSRLSRQNPIEFFALVAWPLQQAGVRVESVQRGHTLDWNDIGDFIVQSVDQFRNNGESMDTSWRVLSEWMLKAGRAELYLGRPPYAYIKGTTADGRPTYLPGDEREVRILQYIFEAYGHLGLSLGEICQELTRRGAVPKKGRFWRQSTIVRWLRDPVYIGTYRFNQTHYGKFYRRTKDGIKASEKKRGCERNRPEDWLITPNNHVPLVDKELFYRVQELLTKNRRSTTPGRNRRDFLLAKLLVCGKCGCRMTGTRRMRSGSGKVYGVSYRCASSYDAGVCKTNTIDESAILPQIIEAIKRWLSPDYIQKLMRRATQVIERACRRENMDPLRSELQKLEKQIERAKRNLSLLEHDDDVRSVSEDIKVWRDRTEEIRAELREVEQPTALRLLEEAIKEAQNCLWELSEVFQGGDHVRLRAILRRTIDHVEVHIEPEVIGKNRHRYHIRGGIIHLVAGSPLTGQIPGGLLNLFNGGPTTEQVSTWLCRFTSQSTHET